MLDALRRSPKPIAPAGPWIDRPDALDLLATLKATTAVKAAARDLIVDGFTILRQAIAKDLCAQVVEDYRRFARDNPEIVAFDAHGRERRLLQFHQVSDSSMRVATDAGVMSVLDFIFGRRTSPYSSLTFKYGTQQELHRDTPHFATWPRNQFVGAWTALEDIHQDAGPLHYVQGGHRYRLEPEDILRHVQARHGHLTTAELIDKALWRYNDQVELHAAKHGVLTIADRMKCGDVAIWHAQLPHGGSPAADPSRSRWSMVVHCTPEGVQGHEYPTFFTHRESEPPADRYQYREAYGRKIAYIGDPVFG